MPCIFCSLQNWQELLFHRQQCCPFPPKRQHCAPFKTFAMGVIHCPAIPGAPEFPALYLLHSCRGRGLCPAAAAAAAAAAGRAVLAADQHQHQRQQHHEPVQRGGYPQTWMKTVPFPFPLSISHWLFCFILSRMRSLLRSIDEGKPAARPRS